MTSDGQCIVYLHVCPACGFKKQTVRAIKGSTPEMMWARELEKLVAKVTAAGYEYTVNGHSVSMHRVQVKKLFP